MNRARRNAKADEMVDIDKMKRQKVKVTKSPKPRRQKDIDIRCEYDGDDTVGIHFDAIEAGTKKAALFIIAGDEVWLPFSQLKDVDVVAQALICSEWIAGEKGLEPDW